MWRSVSVCFTQPGLRSALLLALVLAILPPPPPASAPITPRGAVDVVRAIAGVYRKRSAHQRVNSGLNGGRPTCGDFSGERGMAR